MKIISTLTLLLGTCIGASAQTTITNGGFENWGNASPGISGAVGEPTSWYSNKSGGGLANLGPQTCYKDSIDQHSGLYCVKLITESGIAVVNGVVTTGVVDAPPATISNKDSGYVGTVNYSTASDDRRMAFTGRPDSLVGWYKYTPGGSGEMGKIRCILHTGDYFDPETPTNSYHPITFANRIADDTFFTPSTTVSTWTRFSVPFTYYSTSSPTYIMINATSSANQTTTISGSTLWLDDLDVVYASTSSSCDTVMGLAASAITASSATISWTAVTGAAGYIYAVDNSAAAPASGTFTIATSVPVSGLSASTVYYAHVRDTCGPGSESAWVTTSFPTTTGVKNFVASTFTLTAFPNPVKNDLTINIKGVENISGHIELMDLSGRIIKAMAVNTDVANMSMSGLSAGVYVIRYTDSKHTQTIKVSKQ